METEPQENLETWHYLVMIICVVSQHQQWWHCLLIICVLLVSRDNFVILTQL